MSASASMTSTSQRQISSGTNLDDTSALAPEHVARSEHRGHENVSRERWRVSTHKACAARKSMRANLHGRIACCSHISCPFRLLDWNFHRRLWLKRSNLLGVRKASDADGSTRCYGRDFLRGRNWRGQTLLKRKMHRNPYLQIRRNVSLLFEGINMRICCEFFAFL